LAVGDDLSVITIPFINVLFLKQAMMAVGGTLRVTRLLAGGTGPKYVLVYNLNPPMALAALVSARLAGAKAVAIVADFPHNLSMNFRGVRGLLQRLDVWLEKTSLGRFDAVVSLTRFIAEDFAQSRPSVVIEWGVAASPRTANFEEGPERVCFFSGGLTEVNGIELLLAAFRRTSNPAYRLFVLGRGPCEDLVKAAALADQRIRFFGHRPNEEVLRLQQEATVLINPRPTGQAINRYTFPSKLLEYMASGTPTITTALAGIPSEYLKFLHVLPTDAPEVLASVIETVCQQPAADRRAFGQRAKDFVFRHKTWERQSARLAAFLYNLV
jgi:glycosyltransferase involved in cell wall biosynthesis